MLRTLFRPFRSVPLWLALAAAAAPTPPPELPLDVFFSEPQIGQLRFSPNGRYLAALVPVDRRRNLVVIDIEKKTQQLVTSLKDESIRDFSWANDDRLLFTRDEGGNERLGLYGVKRTGGVIDRLVYAGKDNRMADINYQFGGLIEPRKGSPNKHLVYAYENFRDRPDVAEMDVRSGHMRVLTPNPGFVGSWVLDNEQVVRIGIAVDGPDYWIIHRSKEGEEWKTLHRFRTGEPHWEPLRFDADNRTLYVLSNLGRKTTALYRFDTVTGQLGDLVHADDTYDLSSQFHSLRLLRDPKTKKIVGVTYDADRTRTVYWDSTAERLQKLVDQALPDTANRIIHTGDDDSATGPTLRHTLILSSSDREPGVYSLLDEDSKRIEQIAVTQPKVDPDAMATMQPVTYAARDGVVIHGYLTLPRGREPKGLPLIVHPHGGPYGIRDAWGFDREVQFYANRGFAVLQMNYRGSGGYGDWFEVLGYQKWGLEMQNDISDAVRWAVDQGIADPQRVVISGASYGGYATMAGLTFTPELYCAGINYVGVTDLPLLYAMLKGATARERVEWTARFGDVEDSAVLKRWRDTSPTNFAERIRAPLLMGYGKNDPRVKIEQYYAMEAAMKRAGKPFDIVIEKDEGHGFRKEEISIAWFERVDAFLKSNVLERKSRVVLGTPEVIQMPASK